MEHIHDKTNKHKKITIITEYLRLKTIKQDCNKIILASKIQIIGPEQNWTT